MKKMLAILLAFAMVFALAACGGGSEEGDAPAASGELVLYSSMTEHDLDALITSFNEVYPDITVEVVNGSAGELTTRLTGEAAAPVGDLVWGGMADSDGDKYAEIFEAWVSEYDAENMEGYTSPNGLYSMDHLSTVVFCVNEELEAELGLEIKSYEDLLNPALKGKILTADPNSSSSAWNNLSNIMAVYGTDSEEAWAYIEQLMPNLVIAGSSSACFKSVQQGEYVVGLTYEDGAVTLVKDGAENIRLQYPTNGTSASAFGCALVKNGPNPENAKLMIDFICSADGQTALAAAQEGTLRYTNANYVTPENAWLPAADEITWVVRDVPYMTENKDAILEHWNELWSEVGSN
ncbi:MAG: extracellular solute-binding protein [Firmicutes bacterium]|nr:extracellular solute-binding protein [Bacillota bacterium]